MHAIANHLPQSMRFCLAPALVLLLLLHAFALPARAQAAVGSGEQRSLVFGGTDSFPPFHYQQREHLTGFAVELAMLVAEQMGAHPEYLVEAQWGEVLDKLQRGDIDLLAIAVLTKERMDSLQYSDVILLDEERIFVRRNTDGIQRLQDLHGRKVAVIAKPFSPTDMNEVLAVVTSDLQLAMEESGASVTVGELPEIMADRPQMEQLLRNLLGNALKYRSETPPPIEVSAVRGQGEWIFAVADNGIGIKPEHGERIFRVFQRLHGPGKYPGTGIGLAVCRRILHRHGGEIGVDSQPGQGSVFSFTIPDNKGGTDDA